MQNNFSFDIPEAINKMLENYKIVIVPKDSQLVQLKHGHWKQFKGGFDYIGYPTYECSICHTDYEEEYNYCPNCGAMMDEVKEDE